MRLPRNIEEAIAEFRGLPKPGEHEWDPGATNMASLIEVLFERYRIGQERPEQLIMAKWREIVGEENAARCAPERIDSQDRLVVVVANPILRRELHFARLRILARLRAVQGCAHIRDIEFRAG